MPDITDLLKRWPFLPDDAVVPIKVVEAVTSLSGRTIRYDPRFEKIWLSENRYGYRVGAVKKILLGAWQQFGDVAERVVESCADIRDHQRRMQSELNRRKESPSRRRSRCWMILAPMSSQSSCRAKIWVKRFVFIGIREPPTASQRCRQISRICVTLDLSRSLRPARRFWHPRWPPHSCVEQPSEPPWTSF